MIEAADWKEKIRKMEQVLVAEAVDGAAMMKKHEEPALRFSFRLLALVRVVLDEHKADLPHNRWSVVVVALFTKMISVLRGGLTLARTGHGRELPILIRPALEALITLSFIGQQDRPLRARRWAQFAYLSKYALMRKHPHLFRSPANRNLRRRVRERARRARRYFPRREYWASGLGCSNLREMADNVGLLWHYDAIYWVGSQPTHASALAVDEHIGLASDGTPIYKVGLSGRGVRRDMAAYCDLMIRGLERLEDVFHLGITPIIADAKSEYSATFRGH